MKKSLLQGILYVILCLLPISFQAQDKQNIKSSNTDINVSSSITWPFNVGGAGQSATYSTGTESYYSMNWVDKGSNLKYLDIASNLGITFTRFQPLVQDASVTANDYVSFNIRPLTGLRFTPTTVSFDCSKYGTSGGLIDVIWKSADGTLTTIATGIVPTRDPLAATHATYNLSTLNIPATNGDCTLYLYIYSLANNKQAGIANITVGGTLQGTVVNVASHTLATSVLPVSAGTITSLPIGSKFDEGTSITLTANRNFGYTFKEWREANTDAVVSTANPYVFTLNTDVSLKAVYNTLNTYSFTLNTTGGAQPYMVSALPVGTLVNGQTMYEEGTNVMLTAANNQILTFTNWLTGETNSTLTVPMTKNQNITAVYSAVDYIVGWDFYKAGGSSRPADFYSTLDNQVSSLVLRKTDGTINSWLDKSIVAANGYYGPGAAVNWKPVADQNYYQISFSTKDFTDVKVSGGLLYNYNAYTVQKCEYSIDGSNFIPLGIYTLTAGQTWYNNTFALGADANHADKVYVRWIPDYTSAMNGTLALANDGPAISNIYVTATAAIFNDGIAPILAGTVPAATSTNASTTGKVVLTFDKKINLTSGSVVATLNGKQLIPVVSGKTLTFPYTGLDYSALYNFNLPANSVSDLAGNILTTPVTIAFTTMTRPLVTKKAFDFVVGVDGDFKTALQAATAASATGDRFRIFFPNGQYNIGGNTGDANQKTSIALANVSYVGQNADGVVLYNQNPLEGIGLTATLFFTNTANNLYLQDLTLKNKDYRSGITSLGRCVALQDQGTKNIYKNVNVLSNQDTYYSGSGRSYFEGGSIHGTVDFLCGGGDVFFNETLIYLEERTGNCITAPSTTSNWGYVFSGCTIDGFALANGNFNLGRPWQNSPKSIYINTKMNILPSAAGWTEMGVVPGLFAEYNSTTPSGTAVDVSMRKTSFTYNSVTTPVNPWLSATQAATYTIDNVLGGTDAWQPKLYTDQASVPLISANGSTMNWADNNYVLCWAIFKDGVFVKFTTLNSYTIPSSAASGNYTVCAANEMGGLSAVSNSYAYSSVGTGINNPNSELTLIGRDYYSIDGKKIRNPEGFNGVVIIRSTYSDGHVETSKMAKANFR
jgi:pectin methylesterase-like acyl-CoA thioesterase